MENKTMNANKIDTIVILPDGAVTFNRPGSTHLYSRVSDASQSRLSNLSFCPQFVTRVQDSPAGFIITISLDPDSKAACHNCFWWRGITYHYCELANRGDRGFRVVSGNLYTQPDHYCNEWESNLECAD
jgi:hypothetical protein